MYELKKCIAFQVVHMLRGITDDHLLQMRLQTQFLWDAYFSSVETIVYTTLEVSLNFL